MINVYFSKTNPNFSDTKGTHKKKKTAQLWTSSIKGQTLRFDFGNKKGEKQNLPKTPKMSMC